MDAGLIKRIVSLQWKRSLAIAVCGLLGFICPAVYAWCTAIPIPRFDDEFGYLLAADTFAHGRLTNPTPALPEFFEAGQILVVPTYMSKFPPGQGLCLAVGQVVVGHPVFGVWLSCGVFAASLCWMLQGWVPPRWALALALSVILMSGVYSYWCQSYWGGMVAAAGGALLFGGLRRTIRRPHVLSSLLMGLGIVVLAGTRPFEGLLVCLPAATVMTWWLATERRVSFANKCTGWLLPVSSVCFAGAVGLAIDNRAVTGDWRELPYLLHQRQYYSWGIRGVGQPQTPERVPRCERIARFYGKPETQPATQPSMPLAAGAGVRRSAVRLLDMGRKFLALGYTGAGVSRARFRDSGARRWIEGAVFALVLIAGHRNRWVRFCCATIGLYLIGQALFGWFWPHYAAPALPLLYAATAVVFCRIDHAGRHRWLPARWLLPAIVVAMSLLSSVASMPDFRTSPFARELALQQHLSNAKGIVASRSHLLQQLQNQPGSHLVFVRYSADYSVYKEWVYNAADLNTANVVFAHDLGDETNRRLIELYGGRTIWLAIVTTQSKALVPYDDRPH